MSEVSGVSRPCVLLLQNDPDAKRHVGQAGLEVTGPFRSVAHVHAFMTHRQPDLAILDTLTPDGTAFDLARLLQQRAVLYP